MFFPYLTCQGSEFSVFYVVSDSIFNSLNNFRLSGVWVLCFFVVFEYKIEQTKFKGFFPSPNLTCQGSEFSVFWRVLVPTATLKKFRLSGDRVLYFFWKNWMEILTTSHLPTFFWGFENVEGRDTQVIFIIALLNFGIDKNLKKSWTNHVFRWPPSLSSSHSSWL